MEEKRPERLPVIYLGQLAGLTPGLEANSGTGHGLTFLEGEKRPPLVVRLPPYQERKRDLR